MLVASELGFDLAQATEIKQQLRIAGATESHSVCPYCAVGCSLIAYTRKQPDGSVKILQIEGDPDSPINEGRLCPKGATALQLADSPRRVEAPLYRPPGATAWQKISWDDALDKIAHRIKDSRDRTFVTVDKKGNTVNRTDGIAFAGGAAFSNEEGYLAAKSRPRLLGAASQGLTRSHGGQFGRHLRTRSDDEPLARHQERRRHPDKRSESG
jgi:formate dehydrogenase major subunit